VSAGYWVDEVPHVKRRSTKQTIAEVSPMPDYETILKSKETLCNGTTALYFEKPNGFEFKAGQFADFTLLETAAIDSAGNTRTLSIASAPHENHLMVAMRIRNTGFKRVVNALPSGTPLLLKGPFGNLTLHKNTARPAVFLAGGIGITPFRSMIWHATEARCAHRIYLFYSIRQLEEAAFLKELQSIEAINPRYKFIPTITRSQKAPLEWRGETGHITEQMLVRWVPGLRTSIFYVAGPPTMVSSMRGLLNVAGVCDDDIRAEEFAGY
jgi:ferredoxin-NADP reductase